MQNRRIWPLFSHTELIAGANSSFIFHVCVCLLQRCLLFFSHLLLQHFVNVVHRLASSVHTPGFSSFHSPGVCGWDKLSIVMFDQEEDNCTKGYINVGSLTKYVFIVSKYNVSDLEIFKHITISVWVWTRQKLFGFKPAQALERGTNTLKVLVVFHWRLLSEDKKRQCLIWHLFHPFVYQTIKLFVAVCCCYFLFNILFNLQSINIVFCRILFFPSVFPTCQPPSLSTFQYLNSMPRYNQTSTPHPQVTMSANPPHHCASCHWYHDDCWGSAKAHAQHWPITPSVSGLYSLFMFYWNRHKEY